MGGRCQTSLVLTAKRSKFYAPGDPSKKGVEAIDLGNLTLPEKPLEVLDEAGRPRLSGFPNVVMALDPDQINPMFFVLGADIDLINTPQKMQNLINAAVQHNVLSVENSELGTYSFVVKATDEKILFYFDSDEMVRQKDGTYNNPYNVPGTIDFAEAANKWAASVKKQGDEKEAARNKLHALEKQLALLTQEENEAKIAAAKINPHAVGAKKKTTQKKKTTEIKVKPKPKPKGK
jgi:hypothetical protein